MKIFNGTGMAVDYYDTKTDGAGNTIVRKDFLSIPPNRHLRVRTFCDTPKKIDTLQVGNHNLIVEVPDYVEPDYLPEGYDMYIVESAYGEYLRQTMPSTCRKKIVVKRGKPVGGTKTGVFNFIRITV